MGTDAMVYRRCFVLLVVCLALLVVSSVQSACSRKCMKGQACWPSEERWKTLSDSVNVGTEFIWPNNPNFQSLNSMKNGRVKQEPAVIIFVTTLDDIKKCVNFSREYSVPLTIMSSGHSFIGRSTGDGTMLINLSKMKAIQVNINSTGRSSGGEVTVETGNSWARVYEEVDKQGRVVVGGSSHTVGMGGYTQGGGHSPVSRHLGLAVDNLLEVQVVTAVGHLVTANAEGTFNHDTQENSTDTDLFWALRGGGGGTWGVVISFIFKLHFPPSGFVQYTVAYPFYYFDVLYGDKYLKKVLPLMETLPSQWGGYVVLSAESVVDDPGVRGYFILSLLHWGTMEEESFKAIKTLYEDQNGSKKTFFNKTSFWDYEKDIKDPDISAYRTYIVNSLIQPGKSGGDLASIIVNELFTDKKYAATGCTFTMLGGKTNNPPSSTPVNPGFRSASFSLSCGRTWEGTFVDCINIKHADRFNSRLKEFGSGVYFSEPAQYLEDWKTEFWGTGGNYNRLLDIKKKVDPCNLFTCHNCVGFDQEGGPNMNDENLACSGSRIRAIGIVFALAVTFIACVPHY